MKVIKFVILFLGISLGFVTACATDKVTVPADCDIIRNNKDSVTLNCHHPLNVQQKR